MQVHNASLQGSRIALGTYQSNATQGQKSHLSEKPPAQTSPPEEASLTTSQMFAKYDLTQISAKGLDAMTSDLRQSGFDDVGFILGLETQGETWRNHLQNALGDAGYDYTAGYDPNAPTNVIASTKERLDAATKFGEPTDVLQDQLDKMEKYHAQGHPKTAISSPSQQMAQTLVLFQAQRIWIE